MLGYRYILLCPGLHGIWGFKLRYSSLCGKCFSHGAFHLPRPRWEYLNDRFLSSSLSLLSRTHTHTHTSSEWVVAGYTGASLLLTQWLPSWLPQAVACVSVESGESRGSVTVLTEGGDQSYELEGGESLGALRYRRLPSWGASCPTAAS